jgi:hypothetical protein
LRSLGISAAEARRIPSKKLPPVPGAAEPAPRRKTWRPLVSDVTTIPVT